MALHILLAVNETTSRGHHRLRVVATAQLFVKQHNHIITPEMLHIYNRKTLSLANMAVMSLQSAADRNEHF